ncbi:MAG: hypothetical protein ACYTBJ_07415 [Planctomycetota bacterium]
MANRNQIVRGADVAFYYWTDLGLRCEKWAGVGDVCGVKLLFDKE